MKAGPGGNYVQTFRDKDGNHFDGGRSYRLHVPANPPAAAFWSLTLYDSATRSMVQNPTNDAARSGYDELKTNADGSLDLYFGPEAPAGQESNWIETVPGRGFYPMFRLYSPTAPRSTAHGHCRTSSRSDAHRRRAEIVSTERGTGRRHPHADPRSLGGSTLASFDLGEPGFEPADPARRA